MRKNFIFSLQKVLDLRRQQEDKAKEALALARKRYQEQNQVVQEILEERVRARQSMEEKQDITQADIWLYNLYRDRLNLDLVKAEEKLGRLSRDINQKRQELVEKSKQKKVLERLKHNRKVKFDHEQQQEEQKEFDEMAVLRYQPEALQAVADDHGIGGD
ncbi:flagellar export protein FliJ [Desulfonatronospira thiodismutans ASO3-1]|uniref:Flagellar FliJ protein n=1 Tax=Desulfonatronospira thiodismutans ASO3-1 TaxID=555779 RepID=D6SQD9_9BACT|nr:flagellar export protein FliJ [Desulfonatronospira thiodismutans]EFI34965.1 flagellar export protein FliJ [Desulfonatronospira thiodismutans ASO3-1]